MDGFEFFNVKRRKGFLRTDHDTTALLPSFRVLNLRHLWMCELLQWDLIYTAPKLNRQTLAASLLPVLEVT